MPSATHEVVIFFTGGTIAMEASREGGNVRPAVDFTHLMAELAPIVGEIALRPVAWADLPSPHMTPELMFALARDVRQALEKPEVSGVVVAHGTDVMEESAFLCDVLVEAAKPMVFTGSMRHHGEPGYDGLRNLRSSILVASGCETWEAGVVVCMSDKLFSAREVTKVHSMNIDAFSAPGAGPLGYVVGHHVHLHRNPIRHRFLPAEAIEPRVELVAMCPGMDGRLIDAAREGGAKGLVVEGFGAGNIPPDAHQAVERALDAKVPVVLVSRCIEGGVWPIYGYHGGAAELERKGVVLGGGLPGQKARMLLMAALGCGLSPESLQKLFTRPTYC